MTQKQTFVFKAVNSTELLNNHIAKIVAEGPYKGLMITPTTPRTMYVMLTAGYALTDEGVKIEETSDVGALTPEASEEQWAQEKFLEIDAPDNNYPRRDLIVLRHRYKKYGASEDPVANPNVAKYIVIKGDPTPYIQGSPVAREDKMQDGDIPLAEIVVSPGMQAIGEADIFNRTRTLNATDLMEKVSKALYIGMGNFVFEGWELSSNALNVTVSRGSGLLGGAENTSTADFIITTIRGREYLYHPQKLNLDDNTYTGAIRTVGDNLTLDKQPDYPSHLRITIRATRAINNAVIYITGRDISGNDIDAEPLPVTLAAGEEKTFITASTFRTVEHEGIDAEEVETQDPDARIYIKDHPKAYIYAVGTNSGRPIFEAHYEMINNVKSNYYYLGYAITDEERVIELKRNAVDAFTDYTQDLSDQATGSNRTFVLEYTPKEGSLMFVIDGLILLQDSIHGKGYTLNGNTVTLQDNVVPPDSAGILNGTTPSDVWCRYKCGQASLIEADNS